MKWNQLSHAHPEDLRALQNQKIQYLFQHLLPYHPYYRQMLEKHGIAFSDIQTIEDLQSLPFTTKEDLAPTDLDPKRPRQFILQPDERLIKRHAPKSQLAQLLGRKLLGKNPRERLEWEFKPVHIHFTTGRSARPTPFVYSARDLQTLRESASRIFDVIGASREDTVLNGFPYAPHLAFWLAFFALNHLGMTTLHTGGGKTMGTPKIVLALESMMPQIATFIPGYAYHVFREAVAQGRNYEHLKTLIFGGERVSSALRDRVRELCQQLHADHVKMFATYAFTEAKTAWVQCHEESGYHLYPDLELIEIVDEQGNPVLDNHPGEIVYTSLDWRGSVVVRYRTGDLTKGMTWSPCPHCGRTVPRLHYDIQRKSEFKEFQLTKVKGVLMNLNELFPLMMGTTGIEEWQVEIAKRNDDPFEMDELRVIVALRADAGEDAVRRDIEQKIAGILEVTPQVRFESLKAVTQRLEMETALKEKRIVDHRSKASH
jgi:phenylacetate-coenzyme A ligase PaaK-like adenylate-forming protein